MDHTYSYRDANTGCNRCDHDLTDDVLRHYDDGGPAQCSHCGCQFDVDPAWEMANGYEATRGGEA